MILITGVSGKLGSAAMKILTSQGKRVRGLATHQSSVTKELEKFGQEIMVGDPTSEDSLKRVMADVSQVLAPAGLTIDWLSTKTLVDLAKKHNVQWFVFISSMRAGEFPGSEVLKTKKLLEDYLIASGLTYTILRPSIFFEDLLERLKKNKRKRFLSYNPKEVHYSPISRWDVAQYMVGSLENPKVRNRIVNIGGPEVLTSRELAEIYQRVKGLNLPLKPSSLLGFKFIYYLTRVFNPSLAGILGFVIATASLDFALKGEEIEFLREAYAFVPRTFASYLEEMEKG